jgi:hypothetical protein
VTKIIEMIVVNLSAPKASAKCELWLNKRALAEEEEIK